MFFSQEFFIGLSFACIGAGGMALMSSRRKRPLTTDVRERREQRNKNENLEDDIDQFLDTEARSSRSVSDAESQSFRTCMSDAEDKNLNDHTTQAKSTGELYMDAEDKRAFMDLQHNFKVVEMNCLALQHHVADAMYTFQETVDKQRRSIDDLKLEVSRLKKDLYRSTADLLKISETPSAETNTEKPDGCNLRRLKTRVSVLESDVTKNSTEIVGINRTLMLRTTSFTPATGPPPSSPVQPPPVVTSENFGPPPPPPPMTTGTAVFRCDPVQKP